MNGAGAGSKPLPGNAQANHDLEAALADVASLEERDLSEHIAVFELAHSLLVNRLGMDSK